jgi:glyoxylase-like metal-dependent hydrolase (beta-lactamase superfamily II)
MHAPSFISRFSDATGYVGGFKRIGSFQVGDINFDVLESLGGHVPDQIFLFAQAVGLLFSGDYLIDFNSLSDRTKSTLNLARYLMTSTNNESRVFEREMKQLTKLILDTQERLEKSGRTVRIFPGHGEFYAVDEADWLEE